MKAVILAAGCATRLRPHSDDTPKTLLPVGGVPILRRTITSLMRCGFDQFVIGTGYLEHMVRQAVATWFPTLDESAWVEVARDSHRDAEPLPFSFCVLERVAPARPSVSRT